MKKLIAIVIIVTMIMSFAHAETKTNYTGTWIYGLTLDGYCKGVEMLEINPTNKDGGYTTMYYTSMFWVDGEALSSNTYEGVWYSDGYGYIFNSDGTVKMWIGATEEINEYGYTIFVIREGNDGSISEAWYKHISTANEDCGI